LGSTTSNESNPPFEDINFINIKEVSSNTEISQLEKVANSVQHNVPAWTIFAMFFIVIPLGGALLKEREDGSLLRLKLMPGSYLHIQLGKVLFYVIVCIFSFI
jgi:ABC-2 type transport system permease protein